MSVVTQIPLFFGRHHSDLAKLNLNKTQLREYSILYDTPTGLMKSVTKCWEEGVVGTCSLRDGKRNVTEMSNSKQVVHSFKIAIAFHALVLP